MRRLAVALCFFGATAAALAEPVPAPRGEHHARLAHRATNQPPSLGPASAPVTLELFFVPGAGAWRRTVQQLLALAAKHPQRIRLLFRPLSRQGQLLVPEASLEAHAQGKFFPFIDAAIDTGQTLREREVIAAATLAGVDPERIRHAWATERHRPALAANERRRLRRHGRNTPELLINGVPSARPVASMDASQLEVVYQEAFASATELLADGVAPADLLDYREPPQAGVVISLGPLDHGDGSPTEAAPFLVRRPLALDGLPGEGGASPRAVIVVICNLRRLTCVQRVNDAAKMLEIFPEDVRVVWHPWLDRRDDDNVTAELAQRTVLCAEEQHHGWLWLNHALALSQRTGIRDADLRRDQRELLRETELNRPSLERCLRQRPGAVTRRVAAARAAGLVTGPTVIVGGRAYPGGLTDARVLLHLVENELASGLFGRRPRDDDARPLR